MSLWLTSWLQAVEAANGDCEAPLAKCSISRIDGSEGAVWQLADFILRDLEERSNDDSLSASKRLLLEKLGESSEIVLQEAEERILGYDGSNVPPFWLRLFEDASLQSVAITLKDESQDANTISTVCATKRISFLDAALDRTGLPGRANTFDKTVHTLSTLLDENLPKVIIPFNVTKPPDELKIHRPIECQSFEPSLDDSKGIFGATAVPSSYRDVKRSGGQRIVGTM